MDPIIDRLKQSDGGKILDVATSHGDFLRLLADAFAQYSEAIGVDMAPDRIEKAREKSDCRLRFEVMNAEQLDFPDNHFDTVAIRHSLHHLKDADRVLADMKRVLKPGGLFIVCEVFQSPDTLKENSQRHIHHWWAEVDRYMGVPHFDTFPKEEILTMVDALQLNDTDTFEHLDDFDQADSHEIVKQFVAISNDCIEKLIANNGPQELIDKGNELIERFSRLGFTDEKVVYILGRK